MNKGEALIAARWRTEILIWSDTWPESLFMPSGRRRSARKLLRACMGLAEIARADGALKGAYGEYWSLQQCAGTMGMSKSVALDTLAWLEQSGRLTRARGVPSPEGRSADMRCLVLASVHPSNTTVNQGPRFINPGATVHKEPTHGSPPLSDHGSHPNSEGEPHLASLSSLPSLAPDVAKATDESADTSQSTNPYKTPQQRWLEDHDKAVAR